MRVYDKVVYFWVVEILQCLLFVFIWKYSRREQTNKRHEI